MKMRRQATEMDALFPDFPQCRRTAGRNPSVRLVESMGER